MKSHQFDDAFIDCVGKSVLCWLATVNSQGYPSVSPKEVWTINGDDKLIIADIASPNSVRNIRTNPRICVSFIDIFRQRGFKVEGLGEILTKEHPVYRRDLEALERIAGAHFVVRGVITVDAGSVSPIIAPSYRYLPDVSEQEMMAKAYATYGVYPH